jgi:hypothetical protein
MRILVCGGRNYGWKTVGNKKLINHKEKDFLFKTLDTLAEKYSIFYRADDNWLPSDITIISGAASGADEFAIDWALSNWTDFKEYKANWARYGRAAGPIRNKQMLVEGNPDLVVAFPGGKGTANMVKQAKEVGIEVLEFGL